jgi:hypothetical protein
VIVRLDHRPLPKLRNESIEGGWSESLGAGTVYRGDSEPMSQRKRLTEKANVWRIPAFKYRQRGRNKSVMFRVKIVGLTFRDTTKSHGGVLRDLQSDPRTRQGHLQPHELTTVVQVRSI